MSNEITGTLSAESETADILGLDITGASPRAAIYEVENLMNSSDILHRNAWLLESTVPPGSPRADSAVAPLVAQEAPENPLLKLSEQRTPQRDPALDRSGHWQAELMQAINQTEDLDQLPQLASGGMASILSNSDPVSIMSSIAAYCGNCNHRTAGVALEMALKKLKEEEAKEVGVILSRRKMRIEAKRAKTMRMTPTSVNEEDLQTPMSEPMQLAVEFEEGINYIREQVARSTNDEVQINWEETYYRPMIKAEGEKLVQKLGHFPNHAVQAMEFLKKRS
ncbi:hypothetical protein B0J14DRAFT_660756 [Halenospora varia]|nr:hypothetical protein B0J14DRAFT_660756 [Halenospora varia]